MTELTEYFFFSLSLVPSLQSSNELPPPPKKNCSFILFLFGLMVNNSTSLPPHNKNLDNFWDGLDRCVHAKLLQSCLTLCSTMDQEVTNVSFLSFFPITSFWVSIPHGSWSGFSI